MADETTTPTVEESPGATTGSTTGSSLGQGLGLSSTLGETAPEPVVRTPDEPKHGWWWGVGRRKTAVARVRIKPGSGTFQVQVSGNKNKTVDEYFTEERDRADVIAPLEATGTKGKLDVVVRLSGGGYMGQAGAVVLGLARALVSYDPSLERVLRDHGYTTRDAREVERKKYGQAGARRRFQFSKR